MTTDKEGAQIIINDLGPQVLSSNDFSIANR